MCSCSGSCDCNSITVPRGPQGEKGDTGAQGIQGIEGRIGVQGPVGPQGPAGVVSVEAPLTLIGTPPSTVIGLDIDELVTTINNSNAGGGFIPTGAIVAFSALTPPAGWATCVGQEVLKTGTYAELYAVIGDTYGTPSGVDTFILPDLKTKVPVGYDFMTPLFNTMGNFGGETRHTLLNAEIPKHTHKLDNGVDGAVFSDPGTHTHTYRYISEFGEEDGMSNSQGSFSNAQTGGDGAHRHTGNTGDGTTSGQAGGLSHNNMQPYLVINYIIKL